MPLYRHAPWLWLIIVSSTLPALAQTIAPSAAEIARVALMPDIPSPFKLRDWRAVAVGYDRLAFDENASGEYLPLIDFQRKPSGAILEFGIPPYVGDYRTDRSGQPRVIHDGIATMGSVWGATLIGIDKTAGKIDYAALCNEFFDPDDRVVGNAVHRSQSKGSFWYPMFCNILFAGISDAYPREKELEASFHESVRQWGRMTASLQDAGGTADFEHTGFDLKKMQPVDNGRWKEPDSAAGAACIEYLGYRRFHEKETLAAAEMALRFLDRRPADLNPTYEILMPFGAWAAARANAELREDHDLHKMINWCFDRSKARPDWEVNCGRWEGYDVAGLAGAINNPPGRRWDGGYSFAMNSFVMGWPIVPIARYDPRYAHDIGKYMLNAANAARLFYRDGLPQDRQTFPHWLEDSDAVIAYEGLKFRWDSPDQPLQATGDPVKYHWGARTDLGLYGSCFAGVFGSIISFTEDPQILRLDLLATDLAHPPAYPSYLFFNPHTENVAITLQVGEQLSDIYDAVDGSFLARAVTGGARLTVPGGKAVVAVVLPGNRQMTHTDGRTLVDNIVVDYRR